MERITDKKLQHLVSCINGLLEKENGEIGSIDLSYAYVSVSVNKLINECGGVVELCGYCTKRECYNFLNGLYYGINEINNLKVEKKNVEKINSVDDIRRISVFEYLEEIGILEDLASEYNEIPNTIQLLLSVLEREELNYWSYSVQDKDEIKDIENTVLVYDNEYGERYFELTETEEF